MKLYSAEQYQGKCQERFLRYQS
ncbi:GrpB family protein, partial [Vibrio cholerae]